MRLLPERYDGCVVPWCLYFIVCTNERGTFRRLDIAPKDQPDLWRSIIFFMRSWLISFNCPMMSSKEALSLIVGREKYFNKYTSNWLKWCQLAYQKLLKQWHHFLEFSKLFKGTVNLVYVNFWPTGIVTQWIINEICKQLLEKLIVSCTK